MGTVKVRCVHEMLPYAMEYFGESVKVIVDEGGYPQVCWLTIEEDGTPDGEAECIFTRHDDGTVTHRWVPVTKFMGRFSRAAHDGGAP